MNFLGTHDTVRAINTMCDFDISNTSKEDRLHIRLPKDKKQAAKARLKLATAILYALPGLPTIFYGDEVGLEGYESQTIPLGQYGYRVAFTLQVVGHTSQKVQKSF